MVEFLLELVVQFVFEVLFEALVQHGFRGFDPPRRGLAIAVAAAPAMLGALNGR